MIGGVGLGGVEGGPEGGVAGVGRGGDGARGGKVESGQVGHGTDLIVVGERVTGLSSAGADAPGSSRGGNSGAFRDLDHGPGASPVT